jgi:DNA repair exonuclease SbcCD ATPase subunit
MEQTNVVLSPEQELLQLDQRQKELREELDSANQEKTHKQINAFAEASRRREAEAEEERRVLAEIAKRKREREAAEEVERRLRDTQAAKERQARESQLQREKAQRESREFELAKLRTAREQEARLTAQLEKLRKEIETGIGLVEAEVEPPASLATNPALSRIFGTAEQVSKVREIDSVETAKEQAAQRGTQKSGPWNPRPRSQRLVDQSASAELERAIRTCFKMQVNPQRADQLSAQWEVCDLLRALDIVAESLQGRAIGHDQLLAFLISILEEAARADRV